MAEKFITGGPKAVEPDSPWEDAEGAERTKKLFDTVRSIEQRQDSINNGHVRHAEIYAAYAPIGLTWSGPTGATRPVPQATRNIIRSVCDTATALIAKAWPRPRVVTDGGDWEVQQQASQLDRFLVGVYRRAHVYREAQIAFRDSTIFGTGAYVLREKGKGRDYHIEAERVLISDLIVDENECATRPEDASHWYIRRVMPIKQALKKFGKTPEAREALLNAKGKSGLNWPGNRYISKDHVVIIEGWYLNEDNPEQGLHVTSVEGQELTSEPWKFPWAPIVVLYWSPPVSGFYGDGVAYRQYGRQRRINYLYRWVQRCQDLIAVPRVWVDAVNGPLKVQISNEIGEIVGYRGQKPEFQSPQAVGAEIYNWLDKLEAGGFDDEGISQTSAQNEVPKGIESAPALREVSFKEGTRFAPVSQRWEQAVAQETATKSLAMYREHYTSHGEEHGSPHVTWSSRTLVQEIDWEDVDLETEQYEIRIEASSLEDLSPAGRIQAAIELAQTGWIEPAEGRRLLGHPDLMRADQKATAAKEHAEWLVMNLKKGRYIAPEIYGDLEEQYDTVKAEYITALTKGAEKDSGGRKALELMRTFLRECDTALNPKPENMPMAVGPDGMPVPGAMPGDPSQMGMPAGIDAAPAPAMSLAAAQGLAPMTGLGMSRQNM
jgi:hypothetical protein